MSYRVTTSNYELGIFATEGVAKMMAQAHDNGAIEWSTVPGGFDGVGLNQYQLREIGATQTEDPVPEVAEEQIVVEATVEIDEGPVVAPPRTRRGKR